MSALRYILNLILISTVIFQSNFLTVFALVESEIAIHSIEDLQISAEAIANPVIQHKEKSIEADISSLIAAKAEYTKTESLKKIDASFIVNPIHEITTVNLPTESVGIFDNFMKQEEIGFITGEKNKKIQLDHIAKKQKKVTGIRGAIGVNINSGTIISSAAGEMIDPVSIDILPVTDTITARANEYNSKKNKQTKTPKK